jgi:hypothetical protein
VDEYLAFLDDSTLPAVEKPYGNYRRIALTRTTLTTILDISTRITSSRNSIAIQNNGEYGQTISSNEEIHDEAYGEDRKAPGSGPVYRGLHCMREAIHGAVKHAAANEGCADQPARTVRSA